MNNEIKEILDNLKDTADTSFFAICGTKEELENMPKSVSKVFHITDKHAKVLLDYITNLQKENDTLFKDKLDTQKELCNRIYKAIEEINYWGIDKEHNDDSAMRFALNNLLDILQGSE